MIVLMLAYLGRFINMIDLNEIFTQSLFGKNIRRHQPFDYCDDGTLSTEDPRPIKDQSPHYLLVHWMPKFIIDSMNDLVTNDDNDTKLGENKTHTLTYKDQMNIIASSVARHLEHYHFMKPRPTNDHGQNTLSQYRHLIEQEMQNSELRDFLSIYKPPLDKEHFDKFEHLFRLALQASPIIIKERINRASKYPD